jgi:hypothetical protein
MICIKNEILSIELDYNFPIVKSYTHLKTGQRFFSADRQGMLVMNGEAVKWEQFKINVKQSKDAVTYQLIFIELSIRFDIHFAVNDQSLMIELCNIIDPESNLKTIGWKNLPLVVCDDSEYSFWRLTTSAPDEGGKMWMGDAGGSVENLQSEDSPVPAIYGTLYKPDSLCVFIHSNYPLFPVTHQKLKDGRYAMSLNTYQYRVRNRIMPPLKAQVVFLDDINGDGVSDLSDYRLWLNRHIPDADSIYHKAIVYKIFMDLPSCGLKTTISQAQEIIEAIYNVTDGILQIPYLVGWQYDGHDTGYPSMDKVNDRIGGADALRNLFNVCKENLNTILSYHQNIDDCYPDNPGYDPAFCTRNGICHTVDVETGSIFKRLKAMMDTIPLEKSVQFDNMRITNTHILEEYREIGIIEELVCGLMPIMDWLRMRDITVTTEGQNGMPIDCSLVVSGLWHFDPALSVFQIYHRKVMGGGYGTRIGNPTRFECGTVGAIHQDFSYEPWENSTVNYLNEWDDMVERIYRGVLLYHFFLEREMTKFDFVPGGVYIEYGNKEVIVQNANEHLKVTCGDVLVADDDDRFIPRDGSIYAYSLNGSEKDWVLPEEFRDKNLQVFTLSKDGRGLSPEYRINDGKIWLKLDPKVPVKIIS